jgi:FixJ family two-component response regulator
MNGGFFSRIASQVRSYLYREREVMALVVRGLSNKQIAAELGTKEINRQGYRARVMQKMQASSLADLVRMCDRLERFVPVVAGKRPLQKRAEAKP